MPSYQRTVLSLAVASILSGIAVKPIYADNVEVGTGVDQIVARDPEDPGDPDDATIIVSDNDDAIVITGAQFASSGTGSSALKINTDDGNSETGSLKANVEVNASINGTLNAVEGQASTARGLVIAGDNETNNLQGNITINADITGENEAFISFVDIEGDGNNQTNINGDVYITNNATIRAVDESGSDVAVSVTLKDVAGQIINDGTVTTDDLDGIAFKVGEVGGAFSNVGEISSSVADGATSTALQITDTITGGFKNSGLIRGVTAIDATGGTTEFTNESSGTVSGIIAGGSAINLVNSGTITSSSITAGTLENKAGTVSVTGNATFSSITNKSGASITVDGDLSSGILTNDGSLIVKGTTTASGNFTNGGYLELFSLSLGANTFTNNKTASVGVISGTGNTSVVTNDGTLNLTEGSEVAAYDGSGGTLQLKVTSDTAATPVLNTTGTTTLDKDSIIKVTAVDNILNGVGVIDNKVLIEATAMPYTTLENGDTDGVSVVQDSILLKISDVKFDSNKLMADLEVLKAGDLAKELGMSDSSQSLANLLQSTDPGDQGKVAAITEAYGGLSANSATTGALKQFLDNVRPDDSGSSAHTASDAVTGAQNTISDRSVYTRSGVNTGGMIASGSMWMQALVSKSTQKSREGSLSYNGKLTGYTIGADTDWGKNTSGLAFTYSSSDVDFDRDQKDKVKSYIGSVYNIWQNDNWYLDGSLSFGKSRHEGSRMKDAAALSSKYDSMQFGGMGTLGTYIPFQNMVFEPMVGLRMNHVKVDGYTAKNSDGSLKETVGKTTYKKAEGGLGAAISTVAEYGDTRYQPRIAFMYYRDFVGDKIDQQVNFAGQDYTVQGASAEKNTYELKVGLNAWNDSNMEINLGYTRVMQKSFSSDNFKFKFKYNF